MESPETGCQNRRYRALNRRQRPHARYLNRRNARKLRAIRQRPGNAGSYRSAWWGWKDSNLQPGRYERTSPASRGKAAFSALRCDLTADFRLDFQPKKTASRRSIRPAHPAVADRRNELLMTLDRARMLPVLGWETGRSDRDSCAPTNKIPALSRAPPP